MAKISANGATKLAERRRVFTTTDCRSLTSVAVLCSDGRILRRLIHSNGMSAPVDERRDLPKGGGRAMRRLLTTGLLAASLAACGGHSSPSASDVAIKTCVSRPGSTATLSSCQCAVRAYVQAGGSAATLTAEMQAGTATTDQRAWRSALGCVGH